MNHILYHSVTNYFSPKFSTNSLPQPGLLTLLFSSLTTSFPSSSLLSSSRSLSSFTQGPLVMQLIDNNNFDSNNITEYNGKKSNIFLNNDVYNNNNFLDINNNNNNVNIIVNNESNNNPHVHHNHHHQPHTFGHKNRTVTGIGIKGSNIEDSFGKDMFIILCYSLIIIVSLCGNSLVLKVIASRKKLQTTTNLLIASLAFADVLTTTLNVPFNVVRFIWMNYPFPVLFCKLVPFIQVACVYVSTLTMGVIAIHRHYTLSSSGPSVRSCCGDKSYRSRTTCRLGVVISVVWLLAGLCAIPHSIFNEVVFVPYRNVFYRRCRAKYPKFQFNLPLWLSLEAFLTQYL